MIDLEKLGSRRKVGDRVIARCPACAEDEADKKGEHLVIYPDGRFGCIANQGDSDHRRRVWELVGVKEERDMPPPPPKAP